MNSPLKEIYDFNKYVNTLRVKMAKRVRETKRESGRLPRTRSYKRHEAPKDYERSRNQES
jgi:hypothetical protein